MAQPRKERRFGRYRLLNRLGEGGMGVVDAAEVDERDGTTRRVAIKRIREALAGDASFVSMLVAEARLSAMLRHPNIVQVHEFGELDGEYFLAMEFVDGYDLIELLNACRRATRPVPPSVACHVVAEIAEALAYAHALKDDAGRPLEIVHRDVSPANIMVTAAGGVSLLDFGIAKAAQHVRDERTRTGTLKGKLSYMSPEQAEGLALDRRSDVFALGIVFFELLTLTRLFRGDNDFETLRLVRTREIPPPSRLRAALDPALDAVVGKMLTRPLEDRYASFEEVLAALRPITERLGGSRAALRELLETAPPERSYRDPHDTEPDGRSGTQPLERGTVTGSNGESSVSAPPARRARLWLLALPVAAVLTAIAWPRPAATVAPVAPPNPPPPARELPDVPAVAPPIVAPKAAPATPATVHLRVRGNAGAHVFVDGVARGQIPLDLQLPRTSRPRVVTIRRAGFAPLTRRVAGDEDALVDGRLESKRGSTLAHPTKEIANPFR
jgi:serine/threonine protein kinase